MMTIEQQKKIVEDRLPKLNSFDTLTVIDLIFNGYNQGLNDVMDIKLGTIPDSRDKEEINKYMEA